MKDQSYIIVWKFDSVEITDILDEISRKENVLDFVKLPFLQRFYRCDVILGKENFS